MRRQAVVARRGTLEIDTSRYEIDFQILLPRGRCGLGVLGSAFWEPAVIVRGNTVCASLPGRPPTTTAQKPRWVRSATFFNGVLNQFMRKDSVIG